MDTFKKYFDNLASDKPTKNSRQHHHNLFRSQARKHQNQVARMHGYEGRNDHPIINNLVKNNKIGGPWPISNADARSILNTYRENHTPNKAYSKAIKRTGVTIHFAPAVKSTNTQTDNSVIPSGKFHLTRSKPK